MIKFKVKEELITIIDDVVNENQTLDAGNIADVIIKTFDINS